VCVDAGNKEIDMLNLCIRSGLAAAALASALGGCGGSATPSSAPGPSGASQAGRPSGDAAVPPAGTAAVFASGNVQADIDQAIASGGGTVMLPAGTTRLSRGLYVASGAAAVTLQGAGTGRSTLVVTDPYQNAVTVENSSAVALRDFTIDYDPLPFTQGAIKAVAINGGTQTVDVTIDRGYRTDTAWLQQDADLSELGLIVFDANTRLMKPGAFAVGIKSVSDLGGGVLRFTVNGGSGDIDSGAIAAGDLVATKAWRSQAITLLQSGGTIVSGVTLNAAYGAGVFEYGGDGGSDISITMARGARPPGATSDRLISVNRDGIHSKEVGKGATIHDSLLEHVGDDMIASHGSFFGVTAIDAATNTITIEHPQGFGQFAKAGEKLLVWNNKSMAQDAAPTIVEVDPADNRRLKLDTVAGVDVGDFTSFPDHNGAGITIRRVTARDGLSTAFNIRSSSATIEDVLIEHIWLPGIHLAVEAGPYYYEGPVPSGATLRRVTVRDSCISSLCKGPFIQMPGAVVAGIRRGTGLLSPNPYDDLHATHILTDLRFEDLLVERTGGWGLVLANAGNVVVENSRFRDTNQSPPIAAGWPWGIVPQGSVLVADSDDVRFTRGNTTASDGTAQKYPLQIGPNVTRLDASGIGPE
jgi:hypothetical protein